MITHATRSTRFLRRAARIAVAALALGCTFSAPALADRGSHGHGERRPAKYQRHNARRDFRAPRTIVAPVSIHPRAIAYYEPWLAGRMWFGPHHHDHAVYRFPVYGPTGVVDVPHVYCDGALYHDPYGPGQGVDGFVAISGGGFGVMIGF